jgi:hypothetical protein
MVSMGIQLINSKIDVIFPVQEISTAEAALETMQTRSESFQMKKK